jgi:hypothetical protein
MNCDPRAMRDYASKVTALRGHELALWRGPHPGPVYAPPSREAGEHRWEGEGGRLDEQPARS